MKSIITVNGQPIEAFNFPGGEVQVRIPEINQESQGEHGAIYVEIVARLRDSDGIIALLLTHDAIMRQCPKAMPSILIPYLPYARQDRVCAPGEAFSLSVMVKLIANLVGYIHNCPITVVDPHSKVASDLMRMNLSTIHHVINQVDIIKQNRVLAERIDNQELILVAPDKGASKKTEKLANHFNVSFVQALKERDLQTGKLSGFNYEGDVKGKNLLIVDDICDGGGTFIGLAQKLREGGASRVELYVTHGIFSKGFEPLLGLQPYCEDKRYLQSPIDFIYTTDSIFDSGKHNCVHFSDRIAVIKLKDIL